MEGRRRIHTCMSRQQTFGTNTQETGHHQWLPLGRGKMGENVWKKTHFFTVQIVIVYIQLLFFFFNIINSKEYIFLKKALWF